MADKVIFHVRSAIECDYGLGCFAVDGISFRCARGRSLGFLGAETAPARRPTMKILDVVPRRHRGRAEVAGHDVYGESVERSRIGGPARGYAALPRHDRVRVPRVRLRGPRRPARETPRRHQAHCRAMRPRRSLRQAHRRAVERFSAARRSGPGDHSRARGAGARRADLGPRSEPDRRDPRGHQEIGREKTVIFSTHILRGPGDLLARDHHRRRQARRRRITRRALAQVFRRQRDLARGRRPARRRVAPAALLPHVDGIERVKVAGRSPRTAPRAFASSPNPASIRAATSPACSPPPTRSIYCSSRPSAPASRTCSAN